MEVEKHDTNGAGDDIAMTDTSNTNVQEEISEKHDDGDNLDIKRKASGHEIIEDFLKSTDTIIDTDMNQCIIQETNLDIGSDALESAHKIEICDRSESETFIRIDEQKIDETTSVSPNDDIISPGASKDEIENVINELEEDGTSICVALIEEIIEDVLKCVENSPQMEDIDHDHEADDSESEKNISSPAIDNKTKWWKLSWKPAKKASKEKHRKTFWRKLICCFE